MWSDLPFIRNSTIREELQMIEHRIAAGFAISVARATPTTKRGKYAAPAL
ncbi:hypothetical protein SAMCCGM7_pC1866 (plasmid) [Sinorhizobium americanum CCGM7]|nr:hypothetical protein SAMCCGM7_pC1866 [Sinorhizobium americanum CCGM7]